MPLTLEDTDPALLRAAEANEAFRRVLATRGGAQYVAMALGYGRDATNRAIGWERHAATTQEFLVVAGAGLALDGDTDDRRRARSVAVTVGSTWRIEAGRWHDVEGRLKLLTRYTPPAHPDDTVEATRREAEQKSLKSGFREYDLQSPFAAAVLALASAAMEPLADNTSDAERVEAVENILRDPEIVAVQPIVHWALEGPPPQDMLRALDGENVRDVSNDLMAYFAASLAEHPRSPAVWRTAPRALIDELALEAARLGSERLVRDLIELRGATLSNTIVTMALRNNHVAIVQYLFSSSGDNIELFSDVDVQFIESLLSNKQYDAAFYLLRRLDRLRPRPIDVDHVPEYFASHFPSLFIDENESTSLRYVLAARDAEPLRTMYELGVRIPRFEAQYKVIRDILTLDNIDVLFDTYHFDKRLLGRVIQMWIMKRESFVEIEKLMDKFEGALDLNFLIKLLNIDDTEYFFQIFDALINYSIIQDKQWAIMLKYAWSTKNIFRVLYRRKNLLKLVDALTVDQKQMIVNAAIKSTEARAYHVVLFDMKLDMYYDNNRVFIKMIEYIALFDPADAVSFIKQSVELGARINEPFNGFSPLSAMAYAYPEPHATVVTALLSLGAVPGDQEMFDVIVNNHLVVARVFLNSGATFDDTLELTPSRKYWKPAVPKRTLVEAAITGGAAAVQVLLDGGFRLKDGDFSLLSKKIDNPEKLYDVVSLLLRAGANPFEEIVFGRGQTKIKELIDSYRASKTFAGGKRTRDSDFGAEQAETRSLETGVRQADIDSKLNPRVNTLLALEALLERIEMDPDKYEEAMDTFEYRGNVAEAIIPDFLEVVKGSPLLVPLQDVYFDANGQEKLFDPEYYIELLVSGGERLERAEKYMIATVRILGYDIKKRGNIILRKAVSIGSLPVVEFAVDWGVLDDYLTNADNDKPGLAELAVRKNRLPILEYLTSLYELPEERDKFLRFRDNRPMTLSIAYKRLNILGFLLENMIEQPSDYDDIFGYMLIYEWLDGIKYLFDTFLDKDDQEDIYDRLYVAFTTTHYEIRNYLTELYRFDEGGDDPIITHLWNSVIDRNEHPQVEQIEYLQEITRKYGANADVEQQQQLILENAVDSGRVEIIAALLEDGSVDPSFRDNYLLKYASEESEVELMRSLLADDRVRNSLAPEELLFFESLVSGYVQTRSFPDATPASRAKAALVKAGVRQADIDRKTNPYANTIMALDALLENVVVEPSEFDRVEDEIRLAAEVNNDLVPLLRDDLPLELYLDELVVGEERFENAERYFVARILASRIEISIIPLTYAAKIGSLEIVKMYVEMGIGADADGLGYLEGAFIGAVKNDHLDVVQYLVSEENFRTDVFNQAWMWAIRSRVSLDTVTYLLDKGVNALGLEESFIERLVEYDNVAVFKLMIENFMLVVKPNSLVNASIRYRKTKVIEYALDHDLLTPHVRDHALYVASGNGRLPLVRLLVAKGAFDDDQLEHAAATAAENGHDDVVSFLLAEGVDPNMELDFENFTIGEWLQRREAMDADYDPYEYASYAQKSTTTKASSAPLALTMADETPVVTLISTDRDGVAETCALLVDDNADAVSTRWALWPSSQVAFLPYPITLRSS